MAPLKQIIHQAVHLRFRDLHGFNPVAPLKLLTAGSFLALHPFYLHGFNPVAPLKQERLLHSGRMSR